MEQAARRDHHRWITFHPTELKVSSNHGLIQKVRSFVFEENAFNRSINPLVLIISRILLVLQFLLQAGDPECHPIGNENLVPIHGGSKAPIRTNPGGNRT